MSNRLTDEHAVKGIAVKLGKAGEVKRRVFIEGQGCDGNSRRIILQFRIHPK